MRFKYLCSLMVAALVSNSFAHYVPDAEYAVSNAVTLEFSVERTGPVRAPARISLAPGQGVSGQGFWKFVAARELMPVPPSIASVTNAHGTIIVDRDAGIAYWGLQGVGWIGFSNDLRSSWIVAGNPAFTNGNLHGADILPQHRARPRIAVADNLAGKVYLSDTTFQEVETLEPPNFGTYATNRTFRPTDVAFAGAKELWIVDGYGQQRFLPANVKPFEWQGEHYGRGKRFSMTLHGVTYNPTNDDLLFSARPEGQLKRVNRESRRALDVIGLPAGTLLCDVDLWGDYALAACLEGPGKSPGPIYIINLKKRAIVSTLKPKDELGYEDAQHIHDAAWYVTRRGGRAEVYVLFTNWNPGGIGALRLVNIPD